MLEALKKAGIVSEKYNCNIPWAILLDPTSACNLYCTRCWAAEYGNRLPFGISCCYTSQNFEKISSGNLCIIRSVISVRQRLFSEWISRMAGRMSENALPESAVPCISMQTVMRMLQTGSKQQKSSGHAAAERRPENFETAGW